jgi:Na+/proline symporter
VYITFGLFTNILVTAMLLTGGSAVISSLTGVPTAAACFLLPLGVVVYTMFGGIKATFLTDYVHTVILLVILLTFAFTTYASGDVLGSTKTVYERLNALSATHPVPGNAGGSYLTMKSKDGAIFFVINIIGNFGTVFMDNGCKSEPWRLLQAIFLTCTRLQQGNCGFPCTCSSWLHHWWTELVRYSMAMRYHTRTRCSVPPKL